MTPIAGISTLIIAHIGITNKSFPLQPKAGFIVQNPTHLRDIGPIQSMPVGGNQLVSVHDGNDLGAVGRVSLEIGQGVAADTDLVVHGGFDRAPAQLLSATGSHGRGIRCGPSLH